MKTSVSDVKLQGLKCYGTERARFISNQKITPLIFLVPIQLIQIKFLQLSSCAQQGGGSTLPG